MQHTATHCNTQSRSATHCNTPATHGKIWQQQYTFWMATCTRETLDMEEACQYWGVSCQRHTTTHCNTLQHTATHCNTLQHTATHYNTLQRTATHCNTLQRTATHCHVLQLTAIHLQRTAKYGNSNTLQHLAYSNTLQHTATHCNTPQHTAALCSAQRKVDVEPPSTQLMVVARSLLPCNSQQFVNEIPHS